MERIGAEHALAVRAPVGLHVRVEQLNRGDGPFRSVVTARTVIDVDVGGPWMEVRPWHLAVLAFMTAGAVWLTAIGLWPVAIGSTIAVAFAALSSGVERPTARLLAIEEDRLQLGGGLPLGFADVEYVDVCARLVDGRRVAGEIHDVVVGTPDGEVVAATTASAEQAGHVRDLIENARRAYQRRLTE